MSECHPHHTGDLVYNVLCPGLQKTTFIVADVSVLYMYILYVSIYIYLYINTYQRLPALYHVG